MTRCVRQDSIDNAWSLRSELDEVRVLLMDEPVGEDFIRRPEAYREITSNGEIALFYRSMEEAQQFHDRLEPLRHGAVGYVPIAAPVEVLMSALRLPLHGAFFLPVALAGSTAAEGSRRTGPGTPSCASKIGDGLSQLTARELEVLSLVSRGLSNKMIARELSITDHTVKLHVHNLSRKLNVRNRTEASAVFIASGREFSPSNG